MIVRGRSSRAERRTEDLRTRRGGSCHNTGGRSSQSTNVSLIEKIQSRGSCDTWEVSSLLVIAKEEERFVLDDWTTNRATKLMANIFRFERYWRENTTNILRDEAARISRSPLVIALIIEGTAMELIATTLGDCVNNTASGTTI